MTAEARDLRACLASRGCGPDAVERLVVYVDLIEKWAPHHSLVRFRSREELVSRHIVESLEGARAMVSAQGRLGDLGSGAGLPGVPLLACHPAWKGVLIEPRMKRWAFLNLVIRELGLDARAERCRFEDLPPGVEFDLLTVRALRVDCPLLEFAGRRLGPGGKLLLWSTREDEGRIRRIARWHVLSSALPDLDRGRLIEMEPCFT